MVQIIHAIKLQRFPLLKVFIENLLTKNKKPQQPRTTLLQP